MLLFTLLLVIRHTCQRKSCADPKRTTGGACRPVLLKRLPVLQRGIDQDTASLQDQYQSQLSLLLIEVATLEDINNLYSLGDALGLTKEQVAVPFLLIDRTPLIGVDEINTKLSSLIDKYLTSAGWNTPIFPY